jgi:hypothetical protein
MHTILTLKARPITALSDGQPVSVTALSDGQPVSVTALSLHPTHSVRFDREELDRMRLDCFDDIICDTYDSIITFMACGALFCKLHKRCRHHH